MLKIFNEENAPNESKEMLKAIKSAYGFIPNIIGELAGSPTALKSYLDIGENLKMSNLKKDEKELLMLTVSVENGCDYCSAAHTGSAKQADVADHFINAVKNKSSIDDKKINSLINLCRDIVRNNGYPKEEVIKDFFNNGYEERDLLDIISVVSMKVLTNYVNHIAKTPIDEQFKA